MRNQWPYIIYKYFCGNCIVYITQHIHIYKIHPFNVPIYKTQQSTITQWWCDVNSNRVSKILYECGLIRSDTHWINWNVCRSEVLLVSFARPIGLFSTYTDTHTERKNIQVQLNIVNKVVLLFLKQRIDREQKRDAHSGIKSKQ